MFQVPLAVFPGLVSAAGVCLCTTVISRLKHDLSLLEGAGHPIRPGEPFYTAPSYLLIASPQPITKECLLSPAKE